MELFAKKSLGQHFLTSTHVLEQIIVAAHIQKGENILEIGPGTGILTRALLDTGATVLAVEKDDRALAVLHEKFTKEIETKQLTIVHGDILNAETLLPFTPYLTSFALVANIPYYITGAILQKFLEYGPRPDRIVMLVQKEVAERIIARDGKESILSISVKSFGEPKLVAKVARGAFVPPPSVESAILSIEYISAKHFKDKNIDIQRFFKLVQAGFAHKRKYMSRNIESISSPEIIKKVWTELTVDEKIRAEDVTLSQWLEIASCLS